MQSSTRSWILVGGAVGAAASLVVASRHLRAPAASNASDRGAMTGAADPARERSWAPAASPAPPGRSFTTPAPDHLRPALVDPDRAPVIDAIRDRAHREPAARRAAILDALQASGPTREAWAEEAPAVFVRWRQALPRELAAAVDVGPPRCFRAGCVAPVRLRDPAAQDALRAAFRRLPAGSSEHGGRVHTPAVATATGELATEWILLPPARPL
jgi:hypothetical protein